MLTHAKEMKVRILPAEQKKGGIVDAEIARLHLRAGRACGEKATCGNKIRHPDEMAARKHAEALMRKGKARHPVEPYPCYWCANWHVGREMSVEELEGMGSEDDSAVGH